MSLSYSLAPNPTLQLTDNSGNWVPYGKVVTKDWTTRQNKPTYYDPGGLKPRPNPFELDSIGRAMEVYWETSGAYYLELYNQQGQRIWSTPEPFIAGSGGSGPVTTFVDFTNLFVNGQMRFFPISKYSPIPTGTFTLAEGGWSFTKDGTNNGDSLEFVRFTPDNTAVDASPTYYLEYISLGAGTGETKKDVSFTFQDVRTLSNEQVTVGITLYSAIVGIYPVEIFATQFFGSASSSVTPSASVVTPITTLTPNLTETAYTGTVTLPNLVGKTIGINGDDALIITFRMPLNSNAALRMTDFYFKRGSAATQYPYESYAEVDATVKAIALPSPNPTTNFPNPLVPGFNTEQAYNVLTLMPQGQYLIQQWQPAVPTGMLMLWLSDIIPNDYVEAAGQSLIVSGIYNRLYNVPFSTTIFGKAFGNVTNNASTVYPWEGNNSKFYLQNTLFGIPLTAWSAGTTGFTFQNNTIGHSPQAVTVVPHTLPTYRVTNVTDGNSSPVASTNSGVTVTVVDIGSPSTPAIWDFTAVPPSSITGGTYIAWKIYGVPAPTNQFYIYFVKDGVGTDPLLPNHTGFACNISSTNTLTEIGQIISNAISFIESANFTTVPATSLVAGSNFVISTSIQTFQIYYQIDGSITLPSPILGDLIPVSILSSDTSLDVATKTAAALNPILFKMPDVRGYFPRFTDDGRGLDPNANTRQNRGDGTIGDHPGTTQTEAIQSDGGQYWKTAGPAGSTQLQNGGGPTFYVVDGGDETRPINIYLTGIVKY